MKVANVHADTAPVTLTGNLDKIDFSSTDGKWNIDLTLASSNGRTLTIADHTATRPASSARKRVRSPPRRSVRRYRA